MPKRCWLVFLAVVLSFSFIVDQVDAAQIALPQARVCAVLIGPAGLKTGDYINAMQDSFSGRTGRSRVASGTDIQNLYQAYWISRGASAEGKLTPAIMFNFTGNSCYDKCLFVVAKDTVKKSSKPGSLGPGGEVTRAAVELTCFLTDDKSILQVMNVTRDDSAHDEQRAKRAAFKKGMREVDKQTSAFLTGKVALH